jgi:hypothetical protein
MPGAQYGGKARGAMEVTMDRLEHESFPRMPESSSYALGIVTVIVVVAGFAMVGAWFALLMLGEERSAPVARATTSCSICGVVARVRELEPAPAQPLEGSQAEGAVVLLAALSGAVRPGAGPARLFETSVVHDDGSIRVLREVGAPRWNAGDRVKVVRGRIEPAPGPVAVR